jgi:hypothetical protein
MEVGMFTGTMIDDLIRMVERTELQVRTQARTAPVAAAPVLVYPAIPVPALQWIGTEKAIGVA